MCSVGAPGPRRPPARLEDHVLSRGAQPPGGPQLTWKTMCSVGAPGPRRPLAHLEDHVLSEGMLRTADDVLRLRLSEGHGLR